MNNKERRDYFAPHALQGLIAFYGNEADTLMAVNFADHLIVELDRRGESFEQCLQPPDEAGERDAEREEFERRANEMLDRCGKQIAEMLSMMKGAAK